MDKELAQILLDILYLLDPDNSVSDYQLRSELTYIRDAINTAALQENEDAG